MTGSRSCLLVGGVTGFWASPLVGRLAATPGRIEFVVYGPTVHLRLLPTSPRGDAVTFGYKPENLDLEGTRTPRTHYTYHRTHRWARPSGALTKRLDSPAPLSDRLRWARPSGATTGKLASP